MFYLFYLLGFLAFCIAVGFATRFAAALLCVSFTYVFLIDKALYLNHMYLICLIAFLLTIVPANRVFSVDAWLMRGRATRSVPAWGLWIFRVQWLIVYVYSGISKLDPDWFRLAPMQMMFRDFVSFPLIGPYFTETWWLILATYSIILTELLSPVLLLKRQTRGPMLLFLAGFHLATAVVYPIGIFPWVSLAILTLFLDPDWPIRLLQRFRVNLAVGVSEESGDDSTETAWRPAALALLATYILVQLVVPIRYHLYPGNTAWTREGDKFSWRLIAAHKSGWARFVLTDPDSGTSGTISPLEILTLWQTRKMSLEPDMILQFAHHLAQQQRDQGYSRIQVRAETGVSLNGRKVQPIVDPDVDLAAKGRDLRPASWIVPLSEPLSPKPVDLDGAYYLRNLRGFDLEYGRALELHKNGRLEEAVDAYHSALELTPKSSKARLNLALALGQWGRKAEARKVLEQLVQDEPGLAAPRFELAVLLRQAGNSASALRLFEEAFAINPSFKPPVALDAPRPNNER